jgi:hypothetical protein
VKKAIAIAAVLICSVSVRIFAQADLLDSIGALGAGYMYTSYMAIGTVADGHFFEVYDDETTLQLLEEIKGIANGASESLRRLLENEKLALEDFNFVNEVLTTIGLLYKEAETYQEYVRTKEERYATIYDNYRNNAWAKITELLGIEESTETIENPDLRRL